MPDEPCKHGHGLLIAAFIVGVLILYPLSRGPIAWLEWHTDLPEWFWDAMEVVYFPLNFVIDNGPEALADLHNRYVAWWTPSVTDVETHNLIFEVNDGS